MKLSRAISTSWSSFKPFVEKQSSLKSRIGIPCHQTRRFLTSPLQHITARRTLPYPSLPIYSIIASVPSYSSFLPYCLSSTVTRWSRPDTTYQKQWPEEAVLEIGWGAVRERFKSKIYCVPGAIVEAVGGNASTRLRSEDMAHHTHLGRDSTSSSTSNASNTTNTSSTSRSSSTSRTSRTSSTSSTSRNTTVGSTDDRAVDATAKDDAEDGILTHLLTRWTVLPVGVRASESTDVSLDIEFQFANPVYAAMSSAVAESIAEVMVEAFEKRVHAELGKGLEK